jgi:hypothetical protein
MMTILELKELIRPLSEEDKQELKKMLDSTTDTDILYRLDELTQDLPDSPNVPVDFAENHHRYIRGQVMPNG